METRKSKMVNIRSPRNSSSPSSRHFWLSGSVIQRDISSFVVLRTRKSSRHEFVSLGWKIAFVCETYGNNWVHYSTCSDAGMGDGVAITVFRDSLISPRTAIIATDLTGQASRQTCATCRCKEDGVVPDGLATDVGADVWRRCFRDSSI